MKIKVTIISFAVVAALAVPAYGQRLQRSARTEAGQRLRAPRLETGAGQGLNLNRLAQFLNLTQAQKGSAQQLIDATRQSLESVREDAKAKRQALRDLLDQPNPNPTDLGNAMLAMRQIRETVKAAREKLVADFSNLLTPDQKDKFNTLQSLGQLFRGRGGQGSLAR